MTDKKQLKKDVLAKRDALDQRQEKSAVICKKIVDSNVFKNAKVVFAFLSFGSEVDTKIIVDACFLQGKKLCVPVCKKDGIMDAVAVENMSDMVYNKFGIAEPADVTKVVDKTDIDLVVVPGSVFDKNLNRMGYGKGFYDRYFVGTRAKRVALAFDCQIVDEVPVDVYDVKMHCIVTEKQILGDL
ncbi:MAG: 5-formyltetrahydrofolate cyclo-ligase [Clostridia bacterium]|nr:5-formyltetrahydrofolate cyclo-ligase [Clostridia bacterium]